MPGSFACNAVVMCHIARSLVSESSALSTLLECLAPVGVSVKLVPQMLIYCFDRLVMIVVSLQSIDLQEIRALQQGLVAQTPAGCHSSSLPRQLAGSILF